MYIYKFISHCVWCVKESSTRFQIDADGKICSISIDFYIVNGEYDSDLKWPFEGQFLLPY